MRPYTGPGGPKGPIEIPLEPGDSRRAAEAAAEHVARKIRQGIDPASGGSGYFTPHEQAYMAYLCEIGFASFRGVPWEQHFDGGWEVADVDGYEVKGHTWRRASHMDGAEGGRVFAKNKSRTKIIVVVSAFSATCRERVFFDGWIRTSEVRQLGQPSKWPGKHEVPYRCLHWAREEPLPSSAG